ncbi:MAG: RNA polymerase sigma factor [Bacteroidales bacterium]|nr:RNA polymerase sigma factor [Bacteroidales bacterium]
MTIKEFNNCVDLYSDGIYRFALKMLRNEELAQDNVQDSFEKLWVKHTGVDAAKAKSYLFTTSYNASIDTIRREKLKQGYLQQTNEHATYQPTNYDVSQVLSQAIEQLPDIQKSAILLRDYEGYSYEEIGEITGLNESQVKVYIYRARLFLKNYLVSIDNLI